MRPELTDAGSAALTFNSPLSDRRADGLVASIAGSRSDTFVDFGCGRGAFARAVARAMPRAQALGIDSDAAVIAEAIAHTSAAGLDDRVRFETADASTWVGTAKAAGCIGASHAFGGSREMLRQLGEVVPAGILRR